MLMNIILIIIILYHLKLLIILQLFICLKADCREVRKLLGRKCEEKQKWKTWRKCLEGRNWKNVKREENGKCLKRRKWRCTKLAAKSVHTGLDQQLQCQQAMYKMLMRMNLMEKMMKMVIVMVRRRRVTLPSRALMGEVGKRPKQQLE